MGKKSHCNVNVAGTLGVSACVRARNAVVEALLTRSSARLRRNIRRRSVALVRVRSYLTSHTMDWLCRRRVISSPVVAS